MFDYQRVFLFVTYHIMHTVGPRIGMAGMEWICLEDINFRIILLRMYNATHGLLILLMIMLYMILRILITMTLMIIVNTTITI